MDEMDTSNKTILECSVSHDTDGTTEENTPHTKDIVICVQECPICFEDGKVLLPLTCPKKHMFCSTCIYEHFKDLIMMNASLLCPLCRCQVLSNTTIEYINVREAMRRTIQQQLMNQSVTHIETLEYPPQAMQIIQNIPRATRHDQRTVTSDYKWEKALLSLTLLACLIAFVITFAIMANKA